ncbi:Hypothetical_protein [Hexamita inflata]|uniref:Hypothetical_protein n=1 Tax=Hexamita inflata TaxID=28002 RepID=A0AA86THS8_9EUKA|nr:Hypothetical protein HINF_LOCUS5638 [Hexamita inflata]CAI9917995.1 Hypothetical protein HINF_LOCUS5640 [Hexamita inflata]
MMNEQLLDSKFETEIFNSQIEMKSLFYNLETEIQSNISNLSDFAFESHTDLKQLIISTNVTLQDNLKALQTDIMQQLQQVTDQNQITQAIITDFKSDILNNLSAIATYMNNNQLSMKNNFSFTNSQITNLNTTMQTNFNQVIADVQNTNMNIKNNFTQTNQKIDTVNAQINAVVTNNQFQTQIDLLKQQIQNISVSVSISQSMTSDQYRCLMIAAWYGSYTARDNYFNSEQYLIYLTDSGCPLLKWW